MAAFSIEALLEIARLIARERSGALEAGKQAQLQEWLDTDPSNRALYAVLQEKDTLLEELMETLDPLALQASMRRVYGALDMRVSDGSRGSSDSEGSSRELGLSDDRRLSDDRGTGAGRVRKLGWWWAAAAAVVVFAGGYWWIKEHSTTTVPQNIAKADVAAPVGAKTTLTLSSGRRIFLDSAGNGSLATEGTVGITKTGNGVLEYVNNGTGSAVLLYNTLTTARGGQTSVVLPDGTKVWLNALSTLRYPTTFTGNIREVELTGEAYFEVAHRAQMPFRVKAGGIMIEDIGTHFNVNAYTDEPSLNTTLLEGAVRVNGRVLVPGDQAAIGQDGQFRMYKDVDLDDVVAWKDGLFKFHSAQLSEILRQAARWYDIQIEYHGQINSTISGGISRHVNLSQLLRILELTGKVTFSIEGKKVIVQSLNP
jgi:ferric-dicitrate binding protein FerR (iron transport regulator)